MTQKETKLAVVLKTVGIAPALYENYSFEGKTIERTPRQTRIYADWGAVSFSEDDPEDAECWGVAAKALGIGESPTADPLQADRELADEILWSKSEVDEYEIRLLIAASSAPHTPKEIFAALKRLCGTEVTHGTN